MSTTDSAAHNLTEELAVKVYYSLFYDEAHVLVIIPETSLATTYYAVGDLAHDVVDEKSLDHLIRMIDDSKDGSKIGQKLQKLADKLID